MTQSAIDSTMRQYLPDGTNKVFAYDVPFETKSDIIVLLVLISDGTETTLVLNTDYTVSATNDDYSAGATITTTTAYSALYRLVIDRQEIQSQLTDLTEAGKLPSRTIEDSLDRLTRLVQDLQTEIDRCIKIPRGDELARTTELPSQVTRALKFLHFDSSGNPITTEITPEFLFDLDDIVKSRKSITKVDGFLELVGDETPVAVGQYYGTPTGSSDLGYYSLPTGTAQDAVNGTRASTQSDIQSAIAAAQAGNGLIIMDADLPVEQSDANTFTLTGAVTDTPVTQLIDNAAANNDDTIELPINLTITPTAAAVTNPIPGVFGIPVTSHNLMAGDLVALSGTTNYNRVYRLIDSTTATSLHFAGTYVAETLTSSARVKVSISHVIYGLEAGAAISSYPNGQVMFEIRSHLLEPGMIISTRGFTNAGYNGEFKVMPGSERVVVGSNAEWRVRITATHDGSVANGSEQIVICGTHARDRGHEKNIELEATASSSGKIRIKCLQHGFPPGSTVAVSGSGISSLPDGNYTVHADTGTTNSGDNLILDVNYTSSQTPTGGFVRMEKLVGIPVSRHLMKKYAQINISSTTAYNGDYTLHYLSDNSFDNYHEIVIPATYSAEDFTAGQVRNKRVGIPVPSDTDYAVGDSVTITNTVAYNGTFEVLELKTVSSQKLVVINSLYTAETFDGTDDTIALNMVTMTTTATHTFTAGGNSVWIDGSTAYNGKYSTIGTPPTATTFKIKSAYTAETMTGSGATTGKSLVDIPIDVTFLFPTSGNKLVFGNYLNVNCLAKIFANPTAHIFAMRDDTIPFKDRVLLNLDNGLQSNPDQWGANRDGSNDEADVTATTRAFINMWNTASRAGSIIMNRGTYVIRTLEENVNINGMGTQNFVGEGFRSTSIKLAKFTNDSVIRLHTNGWHNCIIKQFEINGNQDFNGGTPAGTAGLVLEGFNVHMDSFHIEECYGNGLYFAGGQSNDIQFRYIESEQNRGDGVIAVGVSKSNFDGCSMEQCRRGLVLNCDDDSSFAAPDAPKCSIRNCYFEANYSWDIDLRGMRQIVIETNTRSGTGSKGSEGSIRLGKHDQLGFPCKGLLIDGSQLIGTTVRVEPECGENVTVMNDLQLVGDTVSVVDLDGRVAFGRRGANGSAVEPGNARSGTNYLATSHPAHEGSSNVSDPWGDGSDYWTGGSVLPPSLAYLDVNDSNIDIHKATRWQTNVDGRVMNVETTSINTGTYYYRFLWRVSAAYQVQAQLEDTTTGDYYNWREQVWEGSTVDTRHRAYLPSFGTPEFVKTLPIVTRQTRTFSLRLTFDKGWGKNAAVDYQDLVTDPSAPMIHKRYGEVIGYGIEAVPVHIRRTPTGAPHTLNNHHQIIKYNPSSAFTINLAPSPFNGQRAEFINTTSSTNTLTIGRNSNNINGAASDITVSTAWARTVLVYDETVSSWVNS